MTRQRACDYAGAAGRATLEQAAQAGRRWAVQPKIDGCYARVHLDGRGRIAAVYSRAGAPFHRALVGDLLGAFVGWPGAELIGELEAHTEAGNRAAAARGWRALHLFDCVRDGQRYLGREPYRVRRDALWRMQSEVVNLGPECPWYEDDGRARARSSGRWCRAVPTDWRVAQIIPQLPAARAARAWADWGPDRGGEGLVLVDLEAPLGARGAKRKIKIADTLDCRVLSVDSRAAVVEFGGCRFVVSAGAADDRALRPGSVVEVACDGWYEPHRGRQPVPRFPRMVRKRPDLHA